MIRRLRQRHLAVIAGLIVVIPAVFLAGLVGRRPLPVMGRLPEAIGDRASRSGRTILLQRSERVGPLELEVQMAAASTPVRGLEVGLTLPMSPGQPDLLAYWSPDAPAPNGSDLAKAHLLGPLPVGTRWYSLPEAALERDGYLIVYSLAHRSLLGFAPLPTHSEAPSSE